MGDGGFSKDLHGGLSSWPRVELKASDEYKVVGVSGYGQSGLGTGVVGHVQGDHNSSLGKIGSNGVVEGTSIDREIQASTGQGISGVGGTDEGTEADNWGFNTEPCEEGDILSSWAQQDYCGGIEEGLTVVVEELELSETGEATKIGVACETFRHVS